MIFYSAIFRTSTKRQDFFFLRESIADVCVRMCKVLNDEKSTGGRYCCSEKNCFVILFRICENFCWKFRVTKEVCEFLRNFSFHLVLIEFSKFLPEGVGIMNNLRNGLRQEE